MLQHHNAIYGGSRYMKLLKLFYFQVFIIRYVYVRWTSFCVTLNLRVELFSIKYSMHLMLSDSRIMCH